MFLIVYIVYFTIIFIVFFTIFSTIFIPIYPINIPILATFNIVLYIVSTINIVNRVGK